MARPTIMHKRQHMPCTRAIQEQSSTRAIQYSTRAILQFKSKPAELKEWGGALTAALGPHGQTVQPWRTAAAGSSTGGQQAHQEGEDELVDGQQPVQRRLQPRVAPARRGRRQAGKLLPGCSGASPRAPLRVRKQGNALLSQCSAGLLPSPMHAGASRRLRSPAPRTWRRARPKRQ